MIDSSSAIMTLVCAHSLRSPLRLCRPRADRHKAARALPAGRAGAGPRRVWGRIRSDARPRCRSVRSCPRRSSLTSVRTICRPRLPSRCRVEAGSQALAIVDDLQADKPSSSSKRWMCTFLRSVGKAVLDRVLKQLIDDQRARSRLLGRDQYVCRHPEQSGCSYRVEDALCRFVHDALRDFAQVDDRGLVV